MSASDAVNFLLTVRVHRHDAQPVIPPRDLVDPRREVVVEVEHLVEQLAPLAEPPGWSDRVDSEEDRRRERRARRGRVAEVDEQGRRQDQRADVERRRAERHECPRQEGRRLVVGRGADERRGEPVSLRRRRGGLLSIASPFERLAHVFPGKLLDRGVTVLANHISHDDNVGNIALSSSSLNFLKQLQRSSPRGVRIYVFLRAFLFCPHGNTPRLLKMDWLTFTLAEEHLRTRNTW